MHILEWIPLYYVLITLINNFLYVQKWITWKKERDFNCSMSVFKRVLSHANVLLQMSPWETMTVWIVPKTVMLCDLPLHDWLALLSPGEATTSTQSKRPNCCPVCGASSQSPVRLLFNQWTHGQCGTCYEHYPKIWNIELKRIQTKRQANINLTHM